MPPSSPQGPPRFSPCSQRPSLLLHLVSTQEPCTVASTAFHTPVHSGWPLCPRHIKQLSWCYCHPRSSHRDLPQGCLRSKVTGLHLLIELGTSRPWFKIIFCPLLGCRLWENRDSGWLVHTVDTQYRFVKQINECVNE